MDERRRLSLRPRTGGHANKETAELVRVGCDAFAEISGLCERLHASDAVARVPNL
jgi:hypothetical protein